MSWPNAEGDEVDAESQPINRYNCPEQRHKRRTDAHSTTRFETLRTGLQTSPIAAACTIATTAPMIWEIAKKDVGAPRSVTMYRGTIGQVSAEANQNRKTPRRNRRASVASGTCVSDRFAAALVARESARKFAVRNREPSCRWRPLNTRTAAHPARGKEHEQQNADQHRERQQGRGLGSHGDPSASLGLRRHTGEKLVQSGSASPSPSPQSKISEIRSVGLARFVKTRMPVNARNMIRLKCRAPSERSGHVADSAGD